jgi:hypothetical protein
MPVLIFDDMVIMRLLVWILQEQKHRFMSVLLGLDARVSVDSE